MKLSVLAALVASLYASGLLAAPISSTEIAAKAKNGQRLIEVAEGVDPTWKSETEVLDLIKNGVNFVRSFSLV